VFVKIQKDGHVERYVAEAINGRVLLKVIFKLFDFLGLSSQSLLIKMLSVIFRKA